MACWLLSAIESNFLHCAAYAVWEGCAKKGDHLLRTSVVKSAEN